MSYKYILKQQGNAFNNFASLILIFTFIIFTLVVGIKGLMVLSSPSKAKDWVSVQATVLEARVESSLGTDGDGNSYRSYLATGKYRYTLNSHTYESEQLFFQQKSDNIGTYHQDKVDILREHIKQNKPIEAWVNPYKPTQAVVFREIRWSLFFFYMIFPVFGTFSFTAYYVQSRGTRKGFKLIPPDDLVDLSANEFFKNKSEVFIRAFNTKYLIWKDYKGAVLMGSLTILLLYVSLYHIFVGKDYGMIFFLLLPISSGISSIYLYRRYLQKKRFASSKLILNSGPVFSNESIKGEIHIPGNIESGLEYTIKLKCIEPEDEFIRDNSPPNYHYVKWKDSQYIKAVSSIGRETKVIPFSFDLPEYISRKYSAEENQAWYWSLSVEADIRGIDLNTNFKFRISKSNSAIQDKSKQIGTEYLTETEQSGKFQGQQSIPTYTGNWRNTRAVFSKLNGTSNYFFPPFRSYRYILITFAFALFMGLIGFSLLINNNDPLGLIIIPIPILLSIFLIFGVLDIIFYRSELSVKYNEIILRKGWMIGNPIIIKRKDIKRFDKIVHLGGGDNFFYNLIVINKNNKKIVLAKYISEGRDLDSLFSRIKNQFWIKDWKTK